MSQYQKKQIKTFGYFAERDDSDSFAQTIVAPENTGDNLD